jgi:phosphoglycolate phosphatase
VPDDHGLAVLLDLDRTLVDVESGVDYAAAVDDLAAAGLLRPTAEDADATSWGSATVRAMDALVALAGQPGWELASGLVAGHEVAGVADARAMPGLGPFLSALTARSTAIVTLLSATATEHVLATFGIAARAVVARDPTLRPKPAPDQVEAALEALGVRPGDAVMVGDSERDAVAAQGAGVAFIGVTNGRRVHRFPREVTVVRDLAGAATAIDRLDRELTRSRR